MFDIRTALATGIDIPIPECQLILHQPQIREIGFIGDSDFFVGVQTLSLNKTMFIKDENDSEDLSNFHIFMMIMKDKESQDKKQCVQQLLRLIFPNYKVLFTPQSLLFQQENAENLIIDEINFEFLQNAIRTVFCANSGPMDQQVFNPANAQAKEIADKLMRGRQRVAEQKNGDKNISIFDQYISILSVGLHLSKIELSKYTMYQLYDEMERFSLYVNWDLDVRTRLAGGKPDSPADNWMKNLH